jgi:hypothetical protein
VCLEPFELRAHPTRLPCFHVFHRVCQLSYRIIS